MRRVGLCSAGALAGLLTAFGFSNETLACGETGYFGQVCFMAGTYCPAGHIHAFGDVVPIRGHETLFTILGNSFGGDGRSDMGIPDLRARSFVGLGNDDPDAPPVVLGAQRGKDQRSLTPDQLPEHTHGFSGLSVQVKGSLKASDTGADTELPTGNYPAGSSSTQSPNFTATPSQNTFASPALTLRVVTKAGTATASTGSGAAFSTLAPRLPMTACIRNDGTYPPRP